MSTSERQNSLFVSENWTKIYQTFKDADFSSYDFETLRTTMVQYLRNNYPEDFNDYIESSEFIALMDLIAYFGQSLAFRQDLNARENFLETAQRRDSVLRLAKLLSYHPKRNQPARGMLKITSIQTTENVFDSTGRNLADSFIVWNDSTNPDYLEHYAVILNAAMTSAQSFGNPGLKATLNGIKSEIYELNLIPETIPVVPFQADVAGTTMQFEVVNGTFQNKDYIYETAPKPGNTFNMFYRQDGKGAGSSNTGFFFYFKQGELETSDFQLTNSLSNRIVSIDVNGINNDDVWLFNLDIDATTGTEWTKVPAITGNNVIYNSLSENIRTLFAVNSRTNDQIDLVFGDGVFSDIPSGSFRTFYRTSNGRTYRIKPADMNGLKINISYVSRTGSIEELSIGLSLQYTIDNATARDTISDIKKKAPQQYYTQNRMVNGEDYNIFPLTNFNNVIKSKAINRTSSGISRYLDVKDVTGKYSSTNIFANDGSLYRNEFLNNVTFTWVTDNDIFNVLKNTVEPLLRSNEMEHFYFANYERKSLEASNINWNRVSFGSNYSTGYFTNDAGDVLEVGVASGNNRTYVKESGMIKFGPPAGKHFMSDGKLMSGGADHQGSMDAMYSGIVSINNNGIGAADGKVTAQTGAVRLNENIPSTSIAKTILPGFKSDLPGTFESTMFTNIKQYKNFAIGFDYLQNQWYVIESRNISTGNTFSRDFEKDTSNTNRDASWLVKFTTDGISYTVNYRGLEYFFTSEQETRFYHDKTSKVYDPVTGLTKKDTVSVLGINANPTDGKPLYTNLDWNVYNVVTESDGYTDNTKVLVTFADQDDDGIIDNPDLFDMIVGIDNPTGAIADRKLVFLKRQSDYDNFDKYVAVAAGSVSHTYESKTSIEAAINVLLPNSVHYAGSENKFYVIDNSSGTKKVIESLDYKVRVGRDAIKFHYSHHAPNNRRIDPSPGNIIDIYMLTQNYSDAYIEYIQDTSGNVKMPTEPTVNSLRSQFNSLEGYKSLSDALVMHSAKFKPLFGLKADSTLRASFKVVKNPGFNISDSEIKSKMVTALNNYFAIENWDFGETFYFSELSAYLHTTLTPYLNSVVIVPTSGTQAFGSLYQISCEHDEIFVNAATVNDVQVIDSITATNIKATGEIFTGTAQTTGTTTASTTTSNGAGSSGGGGGGGY